MTSYKCQITNHTKLQCYFFKLCAFPSRPMPDKCNLDGCFFFRLFSFSFQLFWKVLKRHKNRKSCILMVFFACYRRRFFSFIRVEHEFWHAFECQLKAQNHFHFNHIFWLSPPPVDRFSFPSKSSSFSYVQSFVYVYKSRQGLAMYAFRNRKQPRFVLWISQTE